ncbi:calcium-binding protein, partial [Paenibacillus sp.]|uniref:calcium-binding protein n=1 Tax=Paenibacillus sp. TaxID=58172 RepID=UPI002D3062B3
MPLTAPTTWKDLIEVSGVSGEQYQPNIVTLKDGRFVAVWERHDGAESDILMRLFNADGTPLHEAKKVNTTDAFTSQRLPVVTALESGGFVIAWIDAADPSGQDDDVRARIFDAEGNPLASKPEDFLVSSTAGDHLDISALGTGFVVSNIGNSTIGGMTSNVYDAQGSRTGGVTFNWASGTYHSMSVASLNGTQFVTAALKEAQFGNSIAVRIQTQNTADQEIVIAASGEVTLSNVSVESLNDGRFMVVWKVQDPFANDQVVARIYTSKDNYKEVTLLSSDVRLDETVVKVLPDGSFVLAYSTAAGDVMGRVFGTNFVTDPTQVSNVFTIRAGSGIQDDPSITVLQDGRLAIGWSDSTAGGVPFVRAQIFDPRTSAVNWTGTGSDEEYFGTDIAEAGDTLNGGGGSDRLFGGKGDDYFLATETPNQAGEYHGADTFNGGDGNDKVSYFNGQTGIKIYLHSQAGNDGAAKGDIFESIEIIDGTIHADVIEGNTGANTFWGNIGDDILKGYEGIDELNGDAGNDTLDGGSDNDTLIGGDGNDFIYATGGGNDVFDGGAGVDKVSYFGAAGIQLYMQRQTDGTVVATNASRGAAAGDVFRSIEIVDGTAQADTIEGTTGAQVFWGAQGADVLKGHDGNDELNGGD